MHCSELTQMGKTYESSQPITPAQKNGKKISRHGEPNEMHGLWRSDAPYYH